jgi:hypothetical protein
VGCGADDHRALLRKFRTCVGRESTA